ncbi:MAG: hypothetical protein IID44_22980 [Planctomycetes bacterium]|nr:hypothetical protein [Planctomycetota bacterium]
MIVFLGDVVAFAAMTDVNVIGAQSVHLLVHQLNQAIARIAQNLQMLIADRPLEDKVTLVHKLAAMLVGNHFEIEAETRTRL